MIKGIFLDEGFWIRAVGEGGSGGDVSFVSELRNFGCQCLVYGLRA